MRNKLAVQITFLVLLMIPSLPASAQTSHGTVIVFGVSRNKVVAAGDSRGLVEGEKPDDHVCKITALGTRLLFTESGTPEERHTILTSKNWSASKQAFRAFEDFQTSRTKTDAIDEVSADWLKAMSRIYSRLLNSQREKLLARDGDVLLTSVFLGLDENGQIKAREIGISFDRAAERRGVPKLVVVNQLWEITDQNVFKVTGHFEIAYEFQAQTSPRARIAAQRWQLELNKHFGADADVLTAVHLLDVSESFAPEDWGIGGPIDVAEMLPKTGVRWIHRKPECPAEGVD